jgi:hypothetical protein
MIDSFADSSATQLGRELAVLRALEIELTGIDLSPAMLAVARQKCCYALQDKVWTHDPDGVPWEYCTILEHIETP